MRIIAGEFRGRKIIQPESGEVRPTKDRIREAVFNVLAPVIPDSTVLDIFAGAGAYGLEGLSRGAKSALFVEKDRGCAGVISENIRILGVEAISEVMSGDASESIAKLGERKDKFDIIFADPPYNKNMIKNILIIINDYDILSPSGLLVVEHHVREVLPESQGGLFICKTKTYGKTSISMYQKK